MPINKFIWFNFSAQGFTTSVQKEDVIFINYQIITSELSAVIILFYLLSAISNPNSPQNSISVFFFLIQRQLTEKLMRQTFF